MNMINNVALRIIFLVVQKPRPSLNGYSRQIFNVPGSRYNFHHSLLSGDTLSRRVAYLK